MNSFCAPAGKKIRAAAALMTAPTRILPLFCWISPENALKDEKNELSSGRQKFVFLWQGQKDSNPRPMVLETSTLPAELYPYRTHTIILDFCAFVKGFLQNKTENIKKETEDFFLPPFVRHCLLCNSFAPGLLSANHAQRKTFPPSP